ncbi:MAG: hypothetical protein JSR29_01525 [Nitrospira sp.]|nr:hypothetical protein [Nitrospira sp.]
MEANIVVNADKQRSSNSKKERERIQYIEARPHEEWFVQTKDEWGKVVWFLRFQATGLRIRRYGPFPTKHRALLFLDRLLDNIEAGLREAADDLGRYQVRRRSYAYRGLHYPTVEDEYFAEMARE